MDTPMLRYPSDTAHPQPIVPIYRIHSINAPFCNTSGCWCQASKAQVQQLFAHASNGSLQLKEVSGDALTVSVSLD